MKKNQKLSKIDHRLLEEIEQVYSYNDLLFKRKKTKKDSKALMAQLLEEGGELAGASRSYFGRSLKPGQVGSVSHIEEELGDCFGVLIAIAKIHKIDLYHCLSILNIKFDDLYKRQKEIQKKNGKRIPTDSK